MIQSDMYMRPVSVCVCVYVCVCVSLSLSLCISCFHETFGLVYLMLKVAVNNFSVMLGLSHRFLGITSTFGG